MGPALNGYYGRPIVKPPSWTDLIPIYFWTGGLAGASATLAFAERAAGNTRLAKTMTLGAAAATLVSAFCLIADLKRPERFLNMLRVFKPTSPMSVGVYVFSVFGGAATTAAACELTGRARILGGVAGAVAGAIGPVMSVYTAVLIGDTAIPAWYHGRKTMPALFAATSASTAGALGMMFCAAPYAGSARRLAIAGGAVIPIALEQLHRELGPVQARAYKRGEAGTFTHAARVLNVSGTLAALLGAKDARLMKLAGAMLLAGGFAERFGVYRAGCVSAKDPSFVITAQRSAEGAARP